VAPEITDIIEALMLLFVATPIVVRWFFSHQEIAEVSVTSGWGSS